MKPGKMLPFVSKMVFKKAATVQYPAVPKVAEKDFRGKLKFDAEKCIGCGFCMKYCPSKAITIHKLEDKKFRAELEMDKCLYCGQCCDSCPKKALEMTTEFELAYFDREHLKVDI